MSHYLIELAVFMLIAYGLGCLFGWLMRNVFGTGGLKGKDGQTHSGSDTRKR